MLPISHWIKSIHKSHRILSIPKADSRSFQIYAAVVMDHIWVSRNQIIHKAQQPVISNSVKQVSITFRAHQSAWQASTSISYWAPPPIGSIKANFDLAIRQNFAVAAVVLSDPQYCIIAAATKRLSIVDAAIGEAQAALLALRLAASNGTSSLFIEGYALTAILAIKNPNLFREWNFSSVLDDIHFIFSSFQSWKALKVSCCANF
jgi:hypothetical protein